MKFAFFILFVNMARWCDCKLFTLEVEDFAPQYMRMARAGASGNFTALLNHTDALQLDFCLRSTSVVNIANIRYSNDGPTDDIYCAVDGQAVGSFRTTFIENAGQGWNTFRYSGPMANRLSLSSGRHFVVINATTDHWGVEIDSVILDISDDNLDYSDLRCSLYCFDNIRYDDVPRNDDLPSGKFVHKSFHTLCSEVDNVNVQIFHQTANQFEIIANLPKYISFANYREPFYDNCALASPFWKFEDTLVAPGQKEITASSRTAVLQFIGNNSRPELLVDFDFSNMDRTREVDETKIGSILTLRLRHMPKDNVKVRPEYYKSGSWIGLQELEYTPFTTEHTWTIPDLTWEVKAKNRIRLSIVPGQQRVEVDELRLDRRPTTDTSFDMYVDPDTVIQGVRLGFWHNWKNQPDSMTIIIQGEKGEYHKVDSLRIYAKVPWTGGFSQVFVMFQDGRTRLQTITPHGLDYIPFGSSITIGQPLNPTESRPYAPIRRITIDPKRLILFIKYMDGNSASFQIMTSFTETKLLVKDAVFKRNRDFYPVMTFKSMWINDGNSDVDHVIINGGYSRHVMSDWRELYGNSAAFFRKCISVHNTQAPDVRIRFMG